MLVQNEVYHFGVKFNNHVKNSKLGSQISWTYKYKKKKKNIWKSSSRKNSLFFNYK